MSTRARIRIEFQPERPMGGTRVFVDDVEIPGVRDITIRHVVGQLPTVTIELIGPLTTSRESEAVVTIDG